MSSDLANPVFYLGPTWVGGGRELVSVQRESSVRMAGWIWIRGAGATLLESQARDSDEAIDPNERVLNADDLAVSPRWDNGRLLAIDQNQRPAAPVLRRFAERTARPLTNGEWPERFRCGRPTARRWRSS